MGVAFSEDDVSPVVVEGGEIEMVSSFTYLSSKLSSDGEITTEVSCRIANASKAFGCLRVPIFLNRTLSVNTKRAVYKAIVISILLYGVETWALKAPDVRRLTLCMDNIGCVQVPTMAEAHYFSTAIWTIWHILVNC